MGVSTAPRETDTYARLKRHVGAVARYTPGTFEFPFGRIRYVDGLSLQFQYLETFVQRGYDFEAGRADPVILDGGGNVGLSVARFKMQYPRSRVTVFEADPALAALLRENVEAMALEGVRVVGAAAWDRPGRVGFAPDGADSGRVTPRGPQRVEAVRLADFVCEPVDLLKLDVEGAEWTVVRDLCETGKIARIQRIIMEIHGREREDTARLLEAMTRHGFCFTLNHARCAPDLVGPAQPTPFPAAQDGKYLLHVYAWRPEA